jgi:alpha-1,3-rhamnosyltransferase
VNQPLVSIIIPSYNHERYVEQAIMSAINQTYKSIELIIIDDGSTDKSPYIIKELLNKIDSSIIVFRVQNNIGLSKTLNKAIAMANGDFIAFLASDDAYLPKRIEECMNVLLNSKSDVCAVYSDGFIIDEVGMKIGRFSDKYIVPIGKNVYKELIIGNWIPSMGILYRKSSILECGLFDENLKVEDYDMLMRLSQRFKFKYIPKPLFLYRWHGLNYSSDKVKMEEQTKLISGKYKDLSSFNNYIFALRNRNFIKLIQECNFLNFELTFRAVIRKIQRKLNIVNVSYFELFKVAFVLLCSNLKGQVKSKFLFFRGLKTGKGTRIDGKVYIIGNSKNISLGNNVRILGDIQFVTEYSRDREIIQIGNDTTIDKDAILFSHGGKIIIGNGCFIGSNVRIQAKGGVYIGNNTMIAPKASIFASNHITKKVEIPYIKQGERFIGISIGENCWIGSDVVILDGAAIGDCCIVGANCVINGQCPPNSKILAKEIIGRPINDKNN